MGKQYLQGGRVGFNSGPFLVIKVTDARFLRIVSRSLFLSLVLVAFPVLRFLLKGSVLTGFDATAVTASTSVSINVDVLNSFLHDLGDEGLLKKEDKALIMSPPRGFEGGDSLFNWNSGVDVVMHHESYDFVFTTSFEDAVSADSVLKVNGIVAFPLSVDDYSSNAGFRKQSNYRVVYLRRYDSIFVALRKVGVENSLVDFSPKRRLCQFASVAKATALRGLEDVLLEPPRQGSAKENKNLKIRYLHELLGDSLDGYKRRVFVGVGLHEENKAAIEWFERNYPMKGTKFQIHSLQVTSERNVPQTDVSAWLSKHVKEDEYVVMKAEADVVEEMMRKNTICLVDELFLQCNNEWWQNGKRKKSGRAYWECLTLYGRLRDEGVAVHQWWD
ncbi:uncharacterized protein LOC131634057 [Vicia villosa]|uniref:uncharacterized protein LOC131634057 n=1 Tax=Vicia villosa TaxID=3911 RepID=UPI00273BF3E5|nr:uncharacterized protein LOC131634057 [Vicia villosa]